MNKEELIAKLKEAKSADQLIAFAKENGIEITPEKAKELFEQLSSSELTDDQLENVAGGNNEDDIRDWFRQYLDPILVKPIP